MTQKSLDSLQARMLVALLAAVCLQCGFARADDEAALIAAIKQKNGFVSFHDQDHKKVPDEIWSVGPGATDSDLETWARLTTVRRLVLDDSRITDAALATIAKLPDLRKLFIKSKAITNLGVQHIADCKNLVDLTLMDTSIDDGAAESLGKLTGLELIDVSGTKMTDTGFKSLGRLANVKKVFVDATAIGADGLNGLAKLQHLEFLGLNRCKIDDEGAKALSQMPSLKKLRMYRAGLNDDQLELLCDHLSSIIYLDIGGNRSITDHSVKQISKLKNLELLVLGGTEITGAGRAELKRQLPKLEIRND